MSTPDDTNISRSGRIRKKSSKLADFQSPDEISEGTKQRRSSKKDGLSGSIFDPPEDTDSETDFGIDDLEMEIDQFDVRLEVGPNVPISILTPSNLHPPTFIHFIALRFFFAEMGQKNRV